MASEMSDFLTEEEVKNLFVFPGTNKQVTTRSKTSPSKTKAHKYNKKSSNGSNEKNHRNRSFRVEYLNDSNSSDERSDNYGFEYNVSTPNCPRGLQIYDQPLPSNSFGRGKPFYPNAVFNERNQVCGDTHTHVDRMKRNIDPLMSMTDSAKYRNENIEKEWAAYKSQSNEISVKHTSNANGDELKRIEPLIEQMTFEHKKTFDPGDSNTIIEPYKNALKCDINDFNTITGNLLDGHIFKDNLNKNDTDISSSNNMNRSKVKDQLYIPPHLRKRNECLASIDDSKFSTPISDPCNVQTSAKPAPNPVKKTVEELTRKNALISGLLKKKQETAHPFPSLSLSSSPSTASITEVSPLRSSTSGTSSACPAHADYCDQVSDLSSAPCSPSPYPALVEFYDLELPHPHPSHTPGLEDDCPLRPPAEFEDTGTGNSFYFYDPDTQQYIHYQIPASPISTEAEAPGSASAISSITDGRASAFVPINANVSARNSSSAEVRRIPPGDWRSPDAPGLAFIPGRNAVDTYRRDFLPRPRSDEDYEDEFPSLS